MKTIVFAASKGGTGKTSLAFAIGIEAAKHGTVYFADVDPQKSLTGLYERRADDVATDNPLLLDDVKSLADDVGHLERSGLARDWLVADTPGSFMDIIRDAVRAADCLVLPVQASPLDVVAQEDIARLAKELGKTNKAFFVLNRIDGRVGIADTIERLAPIFPRPVLQIRQRVDYSRSLIAGRSGAEFNRECAAEILNLWQAIKGVLNDGRP